MKKAFLFIVIISFLSTNLFAQSNSDAWLKYNAEKKSEFAAGALEFLIPVVGHAYAGDAGRGVVPALVSAGGLVIMIAGASDVNAGIMGIGCIGSA